MAKHGQEKESVKICVIAGSLPPQVCGVGDFTAALITALRSRGVELVVIHRNPWRILDIPSVLRELRKEKPDVVHMQYPTHGFRRSLAPHLLHICAMSQIRVTTLHDYHGQRWPVRTAMSVFACGGDIVMDARPDREAFLRRHPWMASHMSHIPIGSNVPGGEWAPQERFTIIHFGMLRPQKGLEEFIELSKLSQRAGHSWRFRVVGAVVPHARDYAERLFRMADSTGIEWQTDAGAEEVSEALRSASIAYLAPAGGLHERRGTLLACAANGLPVIGKVDWATPAFLKEYIVAADTPSEALRAMEALSSSPEELATQSKRSTELDRLFSWDKITSAYIALFEKVLDKRAIPAPNNVPGQQAGAVRRESRPR